MSDTKKTPRPISVESLLKLQTGINLMMDEDNLTGQADIRSSMILDLTPTQVILAQTSPFLGHSWIGRKVGASLVHYDLVSREISRWGWRATVLELNYGYKLHAEEGQKAQVVQVIVLNRPHQSDLAKSNVRQAYRLDAGQSRGVIVAVKPELAPVSLKNFSAGGFMLSTNLPTPYALGQKMSFKLTFLTDEDEEGEPPAKHFMGKAVIVRLEVDPDKNMADLGLQFQELSHQAQMVLRKIINYYMLEEQRNRKEWHERRLKPGEL